MESLKSSILGVKPDSSLIGLLQVMADVEEAGSLEGVSKVADLGIGGGEAGEPIVGRTDGRDFLSLAAVLKDCFAENSDLLNKRCSLVEHLGMGLVKYLRYDGKQLLRGLQE